MPRPEGPANVVILGCGRSGTSIFGELFAALGYRYWSEPQLAELPLPNDGDGDGVAIAVKVPRTEPDDDPPAGLSVSLPRLLAVIPEPRVVFWQVRHPLDAISSLRVGIADGWGHHPRPPDWEAWRDRSLVEQCAHHWATINGPGYQAVRSIAVLNRFEAMIGDPGGCARRAAEHVGADHSVAPVGAWVDRVQDTHNEHFIEAEASRRRSRPDHQRRVGRWREDLTDAEVASVLPIVAGISATLGYDLGV